MKKLLILRALLLGLPLAYGFPAAPAAAQIAPQIVNGAPEFAEPTTGALLEGLDPTTAVIVCSATLIGCDTAITAGHCFNGVNASLRKTLFFQHAGFFTIETAVRHPVYAACCVPGQPCCSDLSITRPEDIAVIKLENFVPGIRPARINTLAKPGPGTPGQIVGFGRDPLHEVSSFLQNSGIKRSGSMTLAACQDPTLSPYDVLCWDPSEVIGDPGEEVSTCNVDSGGPLFVDQAGVRVVAGITKGAILSSGSCIPPVEAYDTNVFRHHDWIEETVKELDAVDLAVTECGQISHLEEDTVAGNCLGLPWGPGEKARVCGFDGELTPAAPQQLHVIQVPDVTWRLRVSLNGTSRVTNPVNVNLYVRKGAPPTPTVFDCAGVATGNFATCEFEWPKIGPWYALLVRAAGPNMNPVEYQVTATELTPYIAELPALRGPGRLLLAGLLLAASLAGLRCARRA